MSKTPYLHPSDGYLHPDDAYIDRQVDGAINRAVLRDEEGNEVHIFPKDWTDEQIKLALLFANKLYAKGVERGKYLKAYEIRQVIDVKEPS